MSKLKDMPTSSLLKHALILSRKDAESDERWDYVHELRRREESGIFESAKNWCSSDDYIERELAADILAQFGIRGPKDDKPRSPFAKEIIPLLETLLDDPEPRVIASSIYGFNFHKVPELLAERASLVSHSSDAVRSAAAFSLGGLTSPHAIAFLIQLSKDRDDDVRDWATFGLGKLCDLNTPDIREALFQRLSDSHYDTKMEAVGGLARRQNERVIPAIKAELASDSVSEWAVDAAGVIGSSELVVHLEALVDWWDVDADLLQAALQRCRGETGADDESRWDLVPSDKR